MTICQQMDDRVHEKLSGVMKPMRMMQLMSIPIAHSDVHNHSGPGVDKLAITQQRWPHTVHGVFCYTEQASNEDGSNGGTGDFLTEPVLLLNVGSKHIKTHILGLDFNKLKKVVMTDTNEHVEHFKSASAKQKSIDTLQRKEKKKKEAKVPKAALLDFGSSDEDDVPHSKKSVCKSRSNTNYNLEDEEDECGYL